MGAHLLTALALVLVIEGAGYALAPRFMQSMARALLELGEDQLRMIGLAAVALGVAGVWLAGVLMV